jgi:ABC-type thiamin/hydroxymethylpyrimidine transport system permease subunit
MRGSVAIDFMFSLYCNIISSFFLSLISTCDYAFSMSESLLVLNYAYLQGALLRGVLAGWCDGFHCKTDLQ